MKDWTLRRVHLIQTYIMILGNIPYFFQALLQVILNVLVICKQSSSKLPVFYEVHSSKIVNKSLRHFGCKSTSHWNVGIVSPGILARVDRNFSFHIGIGSKRLKGMKWMIASVLSNIFPSGHIIFVPDRCAPMECEIKINLGRARADSCRSPVPIDINFTRHQIDPFNLVLYLAIYRPC